MDFQHATIFSSEAFDFDLTYQGLLVVLLLVMVKWLLFEIMVARKQRSYGR